MTPLILLSLLGIAFLIPALTGDGDDDPTPDQVDPVEPVEPVEPIEPIEPVDPIAPDTLQGTSGDDTLNASANQVVNAGSGNDVLTAFDGANSAVLNGGRGDDDFAITASDVVANGERGNDAFDITASGTVANGGDGADTFDVDGNNVTLNGGSGNDEISSAGDNADFVANGGQGDDVMRGGGIRATFNGNAGDDFLTFESGDGTVNGGGGEDTLVAVASGDGLSASLYGEDGDDSLFISGAEGSRTGILIDGGIGDDQLFTTNIVDQNTYSDTLTGGTGNDVFKVGMVFSGEVGATNQDGFVTITDYNPDEDILQIETLSPESSGFYFTGLELNEATDGSYTDVIANYAPLTEGVQPTQSVIRVMGVSDLALSDIDLSTGDTTTAGDDYISSGGVLNQPATISGGLGDDLLLHEGRDDAGALVMEGGDGNDTLIADEIEFSVATTLDGGAGDDVLRTQIFTNTTPDTVDTFITGAGADTIEISSVFEGMTGDVDYGITARVTDFTPGEDVIIIDTTPISDGSTTSFAQTVTLTENTEGNYTDVRFVVTNGDNASTFSGIVRLEGLTGLSEDDIGVSLSDPTAVPDRPAYLYSETSET